MVFPERREYRELVLRGSAQSQLQDDFLPTYLMQYIKRVLAMWDGL